MNVAAAASGATPIDVILVIVLTVVGVALYWLPTFVAYRRHVRNIGSVAILNFFGFLVITWIVALAMALADPQRAAA